MDNLAKKHNLSLILLHGSCVTGKIHGKSDTDVAVVRKNPNIKLNYLALISDLTKKLKADDIDLVDITHANPLLMYAVMRKSKLISGKKEAYEKMLNIAFHKYSDYLPYLKREEEFVKERINSYVTG
ncbi:MAG: nucleotidyltransferase domain-containing protein [bacterium]